MTHPATLETIGAESGVELLDLTPELQELSAVEAHGTRGGGFLTVFSVGKIQVTAPSQKITDGTSNTITFSEG